MQTVDKSAVILLGASSYPRAISFNEGAEAFKISYLQIKKHILPLVNADENILDLFDSSDQASDQYEHIATFLHKMSKIDDIFNLYLFYIGHGGITEAEQSYCLTIKDTREQYLTESTLHTRRLAALLREYTRDFNRYIFIDACFAGRALEGFQGISHSVLRSKLEEISWASKHQSAGGVAVMCAASKYKAAKFTTSGTMFSLALVKAFESGDSSYPEYLTFENLFEITADILKENHPDHWVRPELHVPDQSKGLIHQRSIIKNNGWNLTTSHTAESPHKPKALKYAKAMFTAVAISTLVMLITYDSRTAELTTEMLSETSRGCFLYNENADIPLRNHSELESKQRENWARIKSEGKIAVIIYYARNPSEVNTVYASMIRLARNTKVEKTIGMPVAYLRAYYSPELPKKIGDLFCYLRLTDNYDPEVQALEGSKNN